MIEPNGARLLQIVEIRFAVQEYLLKCRGGSGLYRIAEVVGHRVADVALAITTMADIDPADDVDPPGGRLAWTWFILTGDRWQLTPAGRAFRRSDEPD